MLALQPLPPTLSPTTNRVHNPISDRGEEIFVLNEPPSHRDRSLVICTCHSHPPLRAPARPRGLGALLTVARAYD